MDIKRNYSNDSCNDGVKSFSQKSYIFIPYRIHTGSKPFQCITFKKTFYQAHSLKRTHMRKKNHTGDKTYKFITCQKTFSHASALNTHEVSYNGFKDFKCITSQKTICHTSTLKTY